MKIELNEETLRRYFDNELTPEERLAVVEEVSQSEEWRIRMRIYKGLEKQMQSITSPNSPDVSSKVMTQIQLNKLRASTRKQVIMIMLGTVVASIAAAFLLIPGQTIFVDQTLQWQNEYINFFKPLHFSFDISNAGKFIILFNLLVGLWFFDFIILRPYLRKKNI